MLLLISVVVDSLFVLVFAVIYPVAGFIGFRRLLRKIAAGIPVDRGHLYLSTIVWHWILFILAIFVWSWRNRPWSELGFRFSFDAGLIIALVLALAGIGFLVLQIRQVTAAGQSDIELIHKQLGRLSVLIPRNKNELIRFNILSITAGIVEETLWRGYLIWYLSLFMPVWVAAVISAAGFGIAHAYQGIENLPRIVIVGGILAALFLLSGSLWLPMILHAATDLLQGRLGYEVLRRANDDTSS
jgi:membrane protease YdiL (CAAX protease family)